jgi:hypothetical protein
MTSTEGTPIGDEAQAAAAAQPTETTKPADSAPDAEPTEAPDTSDPVKADVKRALARETQDGKGDEDPGPSDWNGFATEGVEEETK